MNEKAMRALEKEVAAFVRAKNEVYQLEPEEVATILGGLAYHCCYPDFEEAVIVRFRDDLLAVVPAEWGREDLVRWGRGGAEAN
jgi:hypothetical protein